jgi:hypothetical protein
MSRPPFKYRRSKHADLINAVNEFFIGLKINIEGLIPDCSDELKNAHPKPTIKQLDEMMMAIIHALEEQEESLIKY